jgi:hypothetical protein
MRLLRPEYNKALADECRMTEIASHTVLAGMFAVRLHGGPWDDKEVGVRDPKARRIVVNGPRHGNHTVWVTHLYELRGGRYEFVTTEITPLTAGRVKPLETK